MAYVSSKFINRRWYGSSAVVPRRTARERQGASEPTRTTLAFTLRYARELESFNFFNTELHIAGCDVTATRITVWRSVDGGVQAYLGMSLEIWGKLPNQR